MERFEFTFSSATTEPPTGSQIRLDNADPALARKLWVRNVTGPGEDVRNLLMLLPSKTSLYVQDYDDHTRYWLYKTTLSAVDKTSYVEFAVAWQSSGLPLLTQKIGLMVSPPSDTAPGPDIVTGTYATIDELAAALRIRVTPENTASLQACIDAAAEEIDHSINRTDPVPGDDKIANRVNILRGVEWYKANDAAFGVIGFDDTGALQAPRNGFRRHAAALIPLKQQWGIG